MKNLIEKVVNLQNNFNEMIDKNWVNNKNINFRRACWIECAELIDSTNWKWWKNRQTDIQNIEVELVDILHFIISQILRNNIKQFGSIKKGIKHTIDNFLEAIYITNNTLDVNISNFNELIEERFRYSVEELAKTCLIKLDDNLLENFIKLINTSPTNIENVFKMYIAKNVLNKFRQDNGYKEGTYIKQWGNAEDNVVCWNLAKKIEPTGEFEKELYRQLEIFYEMVKDNKSN